MKSLTKLSVAAAAFAAGAVLCAAAPADAQIGISVNVPGVHIGVGVPAPAWYYGAGFYPPGPCDAYNAYYQGDCGYPVYSGPVLIDGVWVQGVHYYRWWGGHPVFWYRGGWHEWAGWHNANFAWEQRDGWGWHDGHFDRAWGRDHWVNDHGHWHAR